MLKLLLQKFFKGFLHELLPSGDVEILKGISPKIVELFFFQQYKPKILQKLLSKFIERYPYEFFLIFLCVFPKFSLKFILKMILGKFFFRIRSRISLEIFADPFHLFICFSRFLKGISQRIIIKFLLRSLFRHSFKNCFKNFSSVVYRNDFFVINRFLQGLIE